MFGSLTPAGLTQASGEAATGTQQTTFDAMTQFVGVMTDPFLAGRGDTSSSGSEASSFADENDALGYAPGNRKRSGSERDAYGMITKAVPPAVTFDRRWSVWAAGFGGSQTTDGNTAVGSNGATSRIFGAAVGADYRLAANTLAGFALAGGGTNFSVANAMGSGHSDLFQAGAFLRHTGRRVVPHGRAGLWLARRHHQPHGHHRRHRSVARALQRQCLLRPHRRRQPFRRAGVDGLRHHAVRRRAIHHVRTASLCRERALRRQHIRPELHLEECHGFAQRLGVRTDKSFTLADAILTLRSRLAWAYDFNPTPSIGATFQTLPGASFVVNGAQQAHNSALTTASAEMRWINGWSAAATFEGEFSQVTRSYAGKGTVRYAW